MRRLVIGALAALTPAVGISAGLAEAPSHLASETLHSTDNS
jgi:hypothetical protein